MLMTFPELLMMVIISVAGILNGGCCQRGTENAVGSEAVGQTGGRRRMSQANKRRSRTREPACAGRRLCLVQLRVYVQFELFQAGEPRKCAETSFVGVGHDMPPSRLFIGWACIGIINDRAGSKRFQAAQANCCRMQGGRHDWTVRSRA